MALKLIYGPNFQLEVLKRGCRTKEDGEVMISMEVNAANGIVFDICGGRSAFIEADEAEELLKPHREQNPYTKICLSNRSFRLGAARAAEVLEMARNDITAKAAGSLTSMLVLASSAVLSRV